MALEIPKSFGLDTIFWPECLNRS